jgi:hypothetical protein
MTRRDDDPLLGTDAWSQEARRVRDLAARLGLTLDGEQLVLQDVRDLQALQAALQGRRRAAARAGAAGPRSGVRAWATSAVAALSHRA